MFFEDEKDNIRGAADISIQEDGTVTWEDVLSGDSDDDLIIQESSPNTKAKKSKPRVNMGDELELVETSDDDIDDQELIQMLNEEPATKATPKPSITPDIEYDTPDIDSQIQGAFSSQNSSDDEEIVLTPRKSEARNSGGSIVPLLLALIIAGAVGYGAWYGINYFSNKESLSQEAVIPTQQTPQQEMNEINQEMLEQRKLEQENIPVVNEEQADEVKPAEQENIEEVAAAKVEPKSEKPERRQVISVVPTGRSNPFLPISKYMTTSIPDTNVDFDSAGIPKPPESYGSREGETLKLMSIAVSGIMYDEAKPSAIITYDNNDYFVQKGDKLDDYKVMDIARTYVTISQGSNIYKANIGEEFKVSSKFYGSAQFMPQAQGGGRQYYSIGTQDRQVGAQPSLRYVSEDDITINTK